jgi:hypothetical protein
MSLSLLRRPSALAPFGLAAAALTLPYVLVRIFGSDPSGDEGVGAHSWQLLMMLQILAILYFLAKWGPREPKPTAMVLTLQVLALLAAAAPVFIFGL